MFVLITNHVYKIYILASSDGLKLNVLMMNLFIINTQVFTSQDINWWTGAVWIIVMFLSAVWTLILTAPIHSLQSIHCWASDVMPQMSHSLLYYIKLYCLWY